MNAAAGEPFGHQHVDGVDGMSMGRAMVGHGRILSLALMLRVL
jgi:hypothetical protein